MSDSGSPALPRSIAIAGAWGYIGRKFVDAAAALGIETFVLDPGPAPADLEPGRLHVIEDEREFYQLPADLFHLALHPEHRALGMELLLSRSAREPIAILCEKPMAPPERPGDCSRAVGEIEASRAVVLYDFPELYDPMTRRIVDFLGSFREIEITHVELCRSKDREDPDNRRNYKRMVTIQYQESVHCIAFALYLLAHARRGLGAALAGGVVARADAEPYLPPNPEAYSHAVDGRCAYELKLGGATIKGRTDFKRGAPWTKRRVIRGSGDGRAFVIEAEYLEKHKYLAIDGVRQDFDPQADSYAAVIRALAAWCRDVPREELMHGLYPHPTFARWTYQLSSVLWRSSWERRLIALDSAEKLAEFDAGYASVLPKLRRY
ncbi:MAG: hypothetical protein KJZ87_01905 [Thermoguttaceae bacterium]|nr:hypothetical protein [Thermoguttaceae bacterium]